LASLLQIFSLWFGFQLRHNESGGKISTKHTLSACLFELQLFKKLLQTFAAGKLGFVKAVCWKS
jgi:hypothetical protein